MSREESCEPTHLVIEVDSLDPEEARYVWSHYDAMPVKLYGTMYSGDRPPRFTYDEADPPEEDCR